MEHQHHKIYSGEFFCSNPPAWGWICSECGEQGTDSLTEDPPLDKPQYDALVKKHHP